MDSEKRLKFLYNQEQAVKNNMRRSSQYQGLMLGALVITLYSYSRYVTGKDKEDFMLKYMPDKIPQPVTDTQPTTSASSLDT